MYVLVLTIVCSTAEASIDRELQSALYATAFTRLVVYT